MSVTQLELEEESDDELEEESPSELEVEVSDFV